MSITASWFNESTSPVRAYFAKPGSSASSVVRADRQGGEPVDAALVGDDDARQAGVDVAGGDGDAGEDRALLVLDHAADDGGRRLGESPAGDREKYQECPNAWTERKRLFIKLLLVRFRIGKHTSFQRRDTTAFINGLESIA